MYFSATQSGRVNSAQIGMNVGITPEAINAISFFIVITFSSYKTLGAMKRFTWDLEEKMKFIGNAGDRMGSPLRMQTKL
jgi:hypothetical protein